MFGGGYTDSGNLRYFLEYLQKYDPFDDEFKNLDSKFSSRIASGTVIVDYAGRIWIVNGTRTGNNVHYYDAT